MNIIAGRHRGRVLKSPKGQATRPVLGRTREALFNVLGDVTGLAVLDLFAGTGALGIEALSRGAASLTTVEQGHAASRAIRENLDMLGEAAEVVADDVFRALRRFGSEGRRFDLVFIDAPYEQGLSQKAAGTVFGQGVLAENGLIAVTVRFGEVMPGDPGWQGDALPMEARMVFDRRYGETRLVIYANKPVPKNDEDPSVQ